MQCFECGTREAVNFGHLCQLCKDALQRKQKAHEARLKSFRYKGSHFADECATCHRKETVLWVVSFQMSDGVAPDCFSIGAGGVVTGVWCEECIAGMVGKPEIESGLTFSDIHDIKFLKKCYQPPMTQAVQDVCEVLKAAGF